MKRIEYFIIRCILNVAILSIYFLIGLITMISTLLQFGFKIILALLLIPIGLMIYNQEWLNLLLMIILGGVIQMILMFIQVLPQLIEPLSEDISSYKYKFHINHQKEGVQQNEEH